MNPSARLQRHSTPANELGWRTASSEIEDIVETEPERYLAYMLRLWQEQGEAGDVWRAMLESPHTGERHGFANLESLFDFLRQRIHPSTESAQSLPEAASEESE